MSRSQVQVSDKAKTTTTPTTTTRAAKNYDRFHQYVMDFCFHLNKIADSGNKPLIMKALKKYRTFNRDLYIKYLLTNMSPYVDYLVCSNEVIFMPEFGDKPLYFLIGLDFRTIWRQTKNFGAEEKKAIFKYLLYLYMQASVILGQNRDKVKEILALIKMEQEIEQEAVANPNAFDDAIDNDDEGGLFGNIASILGENSLIMELAKEIGKEIDITSLIEEFKQSIGPIDPGMIMSLVQSTSGAGADASSAPPNSDLLMNKMSEILQQPAMREKIQYVGKVVKQKLTERNLGKADMVKSLETIQSNVIKKMMKNLMTAPFAHFVKNINIAQIIEQFDISGAIGDDIDLATILTQHSNSLSSEKTNSPLLPDMSQLAPIMSMLMNNNSTPDSSLPMANERLSLTSSSLPMASLIENLMSNPALSSMLEQMEQMQQGFLIAMNWIDHIKEIDFF